MSKISLTKQALSLREVFKRRLLILLAVFSLVVSILIVLAYQQQLHSFRRAAMAANSAQVMPRIQAQHQALEENVDNLVHIIDWSGLLFMDATIRNDKMQTLLAAQADNLVVNGIVLSDASNKPLFQFWLHSEHPEFKKSDASRQQYWYDEKNGVLYFVFSRNMQSPSRQSMTMYFFKAWDSAMLNRLGASGITSYLSIGDKPLLSSAGNLALREFVADTLNYSDLHIGDVQYQQGSVPIGEISMSPDKNPLPLTLTLRTQEKNGLPIYWILGSSLVLILMFSLLLFLTLGRWLRGLGGRLDILVQAVINYQLDPGKTVSPEVKELMRSADTGRIDQLSLLGQELIFLMEIASMRDEEQRAYLQTLDLLQDAVIEFTPQGKLLRATDAWNMLTGLDNILNCTIETCVYPDDVAEVKEQISALTLNQKQQVNIRFRIIRQGEEKLHYWVEGRFAPIKNNEQTTSIRGVVRDITHTYRQERQISHMALHDALTNLPNRVLLEDRMGTAISRAARTGKRVALGFIDLDHFKQVNDNFGHKVGDLLLKKVTERLSNALRSSDTLSRWGGDEFVILCPELNSLNDARDITIKLAALTSQNIVIEDTEFPLLFSAGFAVYPDDAENSETLMAQADRAMFYAKAQGRNNIQFFNAIAGKESGRQSFYIQSRLSNAINHNEIKAWLQPLVLASNGKVIGAEVLARWHENEQGWIPPDVFIPMAESLGMIDRLGQSVWQQALHAITLLPEDHRLSVNLSKRQLFSETIVEQFKKDVSHANISPGRIMLEITESIALSDVHLSRERIQELSQHGFGIAVDDFGVGYSSLSQLHEIPANELKLDISFVRRINEKSGYSMLSAIVSIAKSLNMETVAEGVEDAATADKLRAMGVDVLQGYYFAKPMPIDEYIGWLEARKN